MDERLSVDFSDAKLKVQRANSHIADLEAKVAKFFSRYPYAVRQELNFETEGFGFYVKQHRAIPRELALIVGDAIHNLRTALDYLVSAVAAARGKTINDTHFPFVRASDDLEERLKKDVRKAGPVVMQIVRDLKPYPGGDETLRAIHNLDLIDKHRLVVPVASLMLVRLSAGRWDNRPNVDISGTHYSLGDEEQFIPAPAGYEFSTPTEICFTGEIVFAGDSPHGGKECVPAPMHLADTVAQVIAKFEAAFV